MKWKHSKHKIWIEDIQVNRLDIIQDAEFERTNQKFALNLSQVYQPTPRWHKFVPGG